MYLKSDALRLVSFYLSKITRFNFTFLVIQRLLNFIIDYTITIQF